MLLAEAHEPFSIANAKEPHPCQITALLVEHKEDQFFGEAYRSLHGHGHWFTIHHPPRTANGYRGRRASDPPQN